MVCHTKHSQRPNQSSSFQGVNGKKMTGKQHTPSKKKPKKKCVCCFTLAHRALILKHTLEAKLRCLSDEEIAKSLIVGTCKLPTHLYNATKLTLEDTVRIITKIRNKEGQEIVIISEDCIWCWKRVDEFTISSQLGIIYSWYNPSTKSLSLHGA